MTGETLDEWRARMEAKGARDRHFRRLEKAAQVAVPRAVAPPKEPASRRCVDCSCPIVNEGATPGPGERRHKAHGRCTRCYQAARRTTGALR